MAVLDSSGLIIAVNHAWERFARKCGAELKQTCVGANYINVCQAASGWDRAEARVFIQDLAAILMGDMDLFTLKYPCDLDIPALDHPSQ